MRVRAAGRLRARWWNTLASAAEAANEAADKRAVATTKHARPVRSAGSAGAVGMPVILEGDDGD